MTSYGIFCLYHSDKYNYKRIKSTPAIIPNALGCYPVTSFSLRLLTSLERLEMALNIRIIQMIWGKNAISKEIRQGS